MPVSFFGNAYFLRSIGWAIVNNLWQAGFLWLIYTSFFRRNKILSALIKYYFSCSFLFLSFVWFIFTVVKSYQLSTPNSINFPNKVFFTSDQLSSIFPFFAIIYFTALFFYVIKLLKQYVKLRFVSKSNLSEAPLNIREYVTNTAYKLNITNILQVWISSNVDVPSVLGFFKPIILLPAAMINNLTIAQVNALLLHELAHIKRNDFLANLLQSIVTIALFFNPFAAFLSKIIKEERENCCDDQVLNFNFDKQDYAHALLFLEEQRYAKLSLAMAATDNKKVLFQRVKRLFMVNNIATSINTTQKIQLSITVLSILIAMGLMMPSLPKTSKKEPVIGMYNSWTIPAKIFYENEFTAVALPSPTPILEKIPALKPLKSGKKADILATKKLPLVDEKDFTLALVNDDLISQGKKPTAHAISNIEKDSLKTSFVKIEEQQSGKKQTNTYYFKVKNNRGQTAIEPLLIIKKYKALHPSLRKVLKSNPLHYNKLAPIKRRVTT